MRLAGWRTTGEMGAVPRVGEVGGVVEGGCDTTPTASPPPFWLGMRKWTRAAADADEGSSDTPTRGCGGSWWWCCWWCGNSVSCGITDMVAVRCSPNTDDPNTERETSAMKRERMARRTWS